MKKKLTAMVLAAAMVVTSLFTGITPVKAGTINWEKKEIPVINNIAEWENASAMFTNSISLLDRTDESVMDYVSFTLKQDSWVIMKANSSMVSSRMMDMKQEWMYFLTHPEHTKLWNWKINILILKKIPE